MKFIVDNKHREFFTDHGWIEFEQLLTQEKLYELRRAVNVTLGKRLSISSERLNRMSRGDILMKGRDVWRDSEAIKNVVCNRVYGEIASNLVETTPVRLAYDQILMANGNKSNQVPALNGEQTLESFSYLQGVLCGLLISLQRVTPLDSESTATNVRHTCPIPTKEGNGVFIAPETKLNFPQLLAADGECHLLIVYCRAVSRYVLLPSDPLAHHPKSLGYSVGDRLVDQHNPVLYR